MGAGGWGFAAPDLSLCSVLLAAENMAGSSDRVGFMARIQQKTLLKVGLATGKDAMRLLDLRKEGQAITTNKAAFCDG